MCILFGCVIPFFTWNLIFFRFMMKENYMVPIKKEKDDSENFEAAQLNT